MVIHALPIPVIIQMPPLQCAARKVRIERSRAFSALVADAVVGDAVRSTGPQAGREGLAGGAIFGV